VSAGRVVIIRADWMCKRDSLYYEPLMGRYDLLGVSVRRSKHDLSLIDFPVVTPWSPDSALARLGIFQRIIDKAFHLRSENLMWFGGFENICRGAAILDVAETFHPFCAQAVRFRQNNPIKLVVRAHENIPFAHHNLGFRRKTKRAIFKWADAYITCSKLGKTALVLEGAPADKIHVIPIGADLSVLKPAAKDKELSCRLGIEQNDFVLLFAGRITWEKGIFTALYAAALCREIPGMKLIIAGDGPEMPMLHKRIAELSLEDKVRFTGRVPIDQMPKLYSTADVVVVPSISTAKWQEQFGAVIMEAMACGKGLIVSDSGSIPEVAGDAALYVPQGSHTALADTIMHLYSNKDILADLAKRARTRAQELYDKNKVAGQIGQLYDSLLNETTTDNS